MEGPPEDFDPERDVVPHAQDRLWRHPAERGAAQAEANLAARRATGRHWPSLMVSFIAGGALVGLIWLVQEEPPATIEESTTFEIAAPEAPNVGPLSFDAWADEVAQLNRESVVGLALGGNPRHEHAQAIRLDTSGYLITSAHALEGVEEIGVSLSDGSPTPPAQILGSDPVSGVAVLKINSTGLEPPTFSAAAEVAVRDRLVALAQTAEDGGASALAVDVLADDQVTPAQNGDLLSGLLRLSNELDDPWAGAAVLDENGGIVAMTVASRNGGHFAVPIDVAREVAQQLIDNNGEVTHRAWLGVEMGDLSEGIKTQRDLLGGVLLSRVWDETPAAQGGLLAGDIIVGVGDANILDPLDLQLHLGSLAPGESVDVRYSRVNLPEARSGTNELDLSGEFFTTTVTVGARNS